MFMRLKEWQKIVLLIIICFVIAGFFYSLLFRGLGVKSATIGENSYLELTIAGEVPERAPRDPIKEMFGEGVFTSLQDLLFAVRKAKTDDRIKGIILRPVALLMGWAKTNEFRDALRDFKTSGKPVYAFLEAAGDREYYLATVADTVLAPATGMLFVNGFAGQPTFFKETLDKIGVKADFVAHKEYKTAPQEYTRSSMSPESREVLNEILDQYFDEYIDTLASARKLSAQTIRDLIDQGLFSMQSAFQKGLLDTVMYEQEFKDHLKKQFTKKPEYISLGRYQKMSNPADIRSAKQSVAVIFGAGTIVNGGEALYRQGDLVTSGGMSKAIRSAADDDDIKAIILRLDSPGGSGSASDIIWREVVEARKKKPVFASVSDMAASGGYYIAMAADTIIAPPNSLVGSIGIYAGKFSWKDLYDKIGLKKETIKRGRNADFFSETQPFTPEQRKILSDFLLEFYQDFVNKVAAGRGMTPEQVEKIAKGRVWTGLAGKENGLVDVLGDFDTAIRITKERLGVPADEKIRLVMYPRLESYFERLFGSGFPLKMAELLPAFKKVPPEFRNLVQAIPYFQAGEPLYLYPYNF